MDNRTESEKCNYFLYLIKVIYKPTNIANRLKITAE